MFYSSHIEKNQRYRVIEDFNSKFEHPMVRAIAHNNGSEVRQLHPGYNNVFLGGNGLIILGEESHKDIVEDGSMNINRELWKSGDKEKIKEFCEKHKNTEEKPSVLGLECFDYIPRISNRIHHFHQDRNVTMRMQRYFDKGSNDQQMIELEVWNTKKHEADINNKGKTRSNYQICREVVQSHFLDTHNLENFGNLCHSSSV